MPGDAEQDLWAFNEGLPVTEERVIRAMRMRRKWFAERLAILGVNYEEEAHESEMR